MMGWVVLLLLGGLVLLAVSWWLRRASGLPAGEIAYSDTDAPAQPLLSQRYGLVGKPDYIVMHDGLAIPIEVKPNRTAEQPYESDRLQMAAYCLLIEDRDASAPPYGVLRYRDRSFRIEYAPRLRQRLLDVLDEMRGQLDAEDVGRSHRSAARCAACGLRSQCEERLGR